MTGKLDGKVAIVTGGGQGVGRGIALALAKEGAAVAIPGRTLAKCERTVAEIEGLGGHGLALACNVSRRNEVDATVEAVVARFGTVDILVNNAHTSNPQVPLAETSDKDMHVATAGMYGALYFMQACYPLMKGRGGRIINLGSVAGIRGDVGMGAYAVGKEGVRALTRVAAREWGPDAITVNVICPFSDSPGIDYMIAKDPSFIPQLTAETVLKRLGRSEQEVGRTVVFLASEDGGYITGQTINIDGGIWIAP